MTDHAEFLKSPKDLLSQTLGLVERLELNDQRCRLEYEAGMHMCHSGGVVQGGFISAWLDAAMSHAVLAKTGFSHSPMSLELKISFFAPARPGRIIAEGWVERAGKQMCFTEGRLLDLSGNVLAKASSTIRLMDRARVEASAKAAVGG